MEADAARKADCWFTLDRDWRIASCGDGVPGIHQGNIGDNVWELFPNAEQHFRSVYESAWHHGQSSALIYWNQTVSEVFAIVRHDLLHVTVDYLSVAGLRQTVDRIAHYLDREGSPPHSGSLREHLHVV